LADSTIVGKFARSVKRPPHAGFAVYKM